MPKFFCVRQKRIHPLLIITCLLALTPAFPLIAMGQSVAVANEQKGDEQPSINVHAAGNLVVLRVAVRNSHGDPILDLRKEDFRVYDNGKEQSITQFEAEAPANESDLLPAHAPDSIGQSRLSPCYREFFGFVL